jgi:hypothetical protein
MWKIVVDSVLGLTNSPGSTPGESKYFFLHHNPQTILYSLGGGQGRDFSLWLKRVVFEADETAPSSVEVKICGASLSHCVVFN